MSQLEQYETLLIEIELGPQSHNGAFSLFPPQTKQLFALLTHYEHL